ncbi:DUF1819 family protein [Atopococcus tabaci]|uniref:DUF1819 family protein n=1 Tax=Atopococcus tabaci TaxID=269774 RepID=UPI0003F94A99|nr:DUF1819 family protein [Atopococcus tabaci]
MPRKYTTTLNTRPFLFQETKNVAQLLLDGKVEEDIKKMVLEQNLFQLASPQRALSFYGEIMRRLKMLDEYLLTQLAKTDTQTAKTILLYALLKKDRLFYEWMREVVYNKRIVFDYTVRKSETRRFVEQKGEQEEVVRNWTEDTKRHLIDAYHQVLTDADIAVRDKDQELTLQLPLIEPTVQEYLITKKEKNIVEVVLGEPIL